jgi:hypothetical protein
MRFANCTGLPEKEKEGIRRQDANGNIGLQEGKKSTLIELLKMLWTIQLTFRIKSELVRTKTARITARVQNLASPSATITSTLALNSRISALLRLTRWTSTMTSCTLTPLTKHLPLTLPRKIQMLSLTSMKNLEFWGMSALTYRRGRSPKGKGPKLLGRPSSEGIM